MREDFWFSDSLDLKTDKLNELFINLSVNEIELYDGFWEILPLLQNPETHKFMSFKSNSLAQYKAMDIGGINAYFMINISLDTQKIIHTRQVETVLDVFGEMGGLFDFIILLTALLVSPYSEFAFNLKAIQQMYIAKTKDDVIFEK